MEEEGNPGGNQWYARVIHDGLQRLVVFCPYGIDGGFPRGVRNAVVVSEAMANHLIEHATGRSNGILSLGEPAENGVVDFDHVALLSSCLLIYGEDVRHFIVHAIREIHLRIGATDSPDQRYMVHCAKTFLRRFGLSRYSGPPLLRIRRMNANNAPNAIEQAAVDELLDALSANPSTDIRLRIEVDVAPSRDVFKRLVDSHWTNRRLCMSEREAALLRVGGSDGADRFTVDVRFRCGTFVRVGTSRRDDCSHRGQPFTSRHRYSFSHSSGSGVVTGVVNRNH
jgi:hypothetical protein